jgi:hypothetical protein
VRSRGGARSAYRLLVGRGAVKKQSSFLTPRALCEHALAATHDESKPMLGEDVCLASGVGSDRRAVSAAGAFASERRAASRGASRWYREACRSTGCNGPRWW